MTRLLIAFLMNACGGKSLVSQRRSPISTLLRLTFFALVSLL